MCKGAMHSVLRLRMFPLVAEVHLRLLIACLLALVLVACAEPDAPSSGAGAEPRATSSATSSAAPDNPPGSFPGGETKGRNADSAAKLALDGEGLRAFSVPSGASRLIAFGQDEQATMRALEVVLGAPPLERGEDIDCGAVLATWPQALTTWFSGDRFVGWSVGAESQMSSAGGLRLGISRQELDRAATTVHIAASTLGTEFDTAGMGGLLDSDSADARVSHLWAGATCIAR